MRPVNRGSCPEANGKSVVFTDYAGARGSLIERLGEYCSYCEMRLNASLAVEHRLPKSSGRYAHLELSWSNFLLACVNCNSTQGDDNIDEDDCLWPDRHNTLFAIEYGPGAEVNPRDNNRIDAKDRVRAQKLIHLVGLDQKPGKRTLRTASDRRWLSRQNAWDKAHRMLHNLRKNDTPELREAIADNAQSTGFFSVWYTVFADVPQVLRLIRQRYAGTAEECFGEDESCLPRVMR